MKLIQGDCLDAMADLPDGSVDLVFCDLPYGTTVNTWDSRIPLDRLWTHWHRLSKPDTPVLLFGQQPFASTLVMSNPKEFRYEWIYEKTNATGFLNARKMPLKAHESILVFYRRLPVYHPQFTEGEPYCKSQGLHSSSNYRKLDIRVKTYSDGRRYPRDVLTFRNVSWGPDRRLHPTQKPLDLVEYMVRTYTDPGDTVLDCCMGSGTTGVACVNTGREFVGIELDGNYFQTAENRIEAAARARETEGET